MQSIGEETAFAQLATTSEPILVRHAFGDLWKNRSEFITRHGGTRVPVGTGGLFGSDWTSGPLTQHPYLPVAEYVRALRSGALSDSYVFADVGDNKAIVADLEQWPRFFEGLTVERLGGNSALKKAASSEPNGAFSGTVFLSIGTGGSGGSYHRHSDALAVVMAGTKRWFVRRWAARGIGHNELDHTHARELAKREFADADVWQCVQRAGELLFVPAGLHHAVVNLGETLGASIQHNAFGFHGQSLMHVAAANGRASAIRALLQAGAEVDVTDENGATPLHYAADAGHVEAVDALLEDGDASVRATTHPNLDNLTALHLARRGDVASRLMQSGAAVCSAFSGAGQLPLHVAARHGYVDAVRAMLKWGKECGAIALPDRFGGHPLQCVKPAQHSHPRPAPRQMYPLMRLCDALFTLSSRSYATSAGHVETTLVLLQAGANARAQDHAGMTPLHIAAMDGQIAAAKALVDAGARLDDADAEGWTPLDHARDAGQRDFEAAFRDWLGAKDEL